MWTASYGGSAPSSSRPTPKRVNYTVLDVNEGTEKREADAYIAAYAKGGEPVGEFPNQTRHSTRPSSSAPKAERNNQQ